MVWFKFVLESQVVKCSEESFMHTDYKKLIYLHLLTGCFMKISVHSSEQTFLWRLKKKLHETAYKQMKIN